MTSNRQPLPRFRRELARIAPYRVSNPPTRHKLNQNESDLELPQELRRRILRRLERSDWRRYPDYPPTELQTAIARHERLAAGRVLVGHASNELLYALALATLERGTSCLAPAPSYPVTRLAVDLAGATLSTVPLAHDFRYDVDRILSQLRRHRPRMVFLPAPNNPTGSSLDRDAVDAITASAARLRSLVVIDEAYHEFSTVRLRPLLNRHRNLVLLRTLSKAYRIAAFRVGYLLGDREVLDHVERARPPHSIDLLGQIAGLVVFEDPTFIRGEVERVKKERNRFFDALSSLPGVEVFPSEANFLLARVRAAGALYRTLLDSGYLVRAVGLHRSAPRSLKNCLRITIGNAKENREMARIIARHSRGPR